MIELTAGARFDDTDGTGTFLHIEQGQLYELDPCQTLLFSALLRAATVEAAVAELKGQIEASDLEIQQSLGLLIQQLEMHDLVQQPTRGEAASNAHLEGSGLVAGCEARVPCSSDGERPGATPAPRSHSSRGRPPGGERIAWEFFLTGTLDNVPLPALSLRQRFRGARAVVGILLQFQLQHDRWMPGAMATLNTLGAGSPAMACLTPPDMQRVARRELAYCQPLVRMLAPLGLCIPRSLALCAYLRAIGLPAQFVLARARFHTAPHAFHAWTEVAGLTVNETAEALTGYTVLERIPA